MLFGKLGALFGRLGASSVSAGAPAGEGFLTVTDQNGTEQFITVTDQNGIEQKLTVTTAALPSGGGGSALLADVGVNLLADVGSPILVQ